MVTLGVIAKFYSRVVLISLEYASCGKMNSFQLIVPVLFLLRFAVPLSTLLLDPTMMILPQQMPSVNDCVMFVQIYLAVMMQ